MTQADRHHKHRQIADQKVALATLASEPKFSAAVISIINTTTMMLPRYSAATEVYSLASAVRVRCPCCP